MDIQSYISSGIIEQYALGVLSKEEASILECVMKNNAEVAAAVLEAQKVLEDLTLAQSIKPPAELKTQILAKISFDKLSTEPEVKDAFRSTLAEEKKIEQSQGKTNFAAWFAIAASLLLALSLGWNIYSSNSKNEKMDALAKNNTDLENRLENIQRQQDMIINSQKIDLKGVENHPGMLASVYWDSSKDVYLNINNLPQAPQGKQYQLWAIVDGKPVDAGMYDQERPDKIQKMKTIENAQAFAITLENEGGSATPTMEEMYVMGEI